MCFGVCVFCWAQGVYSVMPNCCGESALVPESSVKGNTGHHEIDVQTRQCGGSFQPSNKLYV